jgi:hypothetical protein
MLRVVGAATEVELDWVVEEVEVVAGPLLVDEMELDELVVELVEL